MLAFNGLKVWWFGVPARITEVGGGFTEVDGGYRLSYQNPDRPLARVRFKAAAKRVRFLKRATGGIVIAVAAAAIIKWLGLS